MKVTNITNITDVTKLRGISSGEVVVPTLPDLPVSLPAYAQWRLDSYSLTGSKISQMDDLIGTNHIKQSTDSLRPVVSSEQINGFDMIHFDANVLLTDGNIGLDSSDELAWLFVGKRIDNNGAMFGWGDTFVGQRIFFSTKFRIDNYARYKDFLNTDYNVNEYVLVNDIFPSLYYVTTERNGSALSETNENNKGSGTNQVDDIFVVGMANDTVTPASEFYLADLILLNAHLTAGNLTTLRGYINEAWGLSIS